ncbi:L-histidine N(alpha)-methyltransferase [Altererythrobacter sp.]|uniref:L-histidine N(alpha)-methyltransferase n=1 Tax=Altererythrobacter sp. TaxID=1872480 RepID=UPI001B073E9E|nr:L-histidine N(alpha)-methyltransferase [Altererythrobacter sp.]MBO6608701.1 L-histidine N(alpha)-methyltransferase [Altererythrobacter sp.]MBO6642956.1 L-histidine N(alpha)-methyltransferase [Altererythrobacter sp.]MBO6709699.1 L-histidine N(alpha)-methyltransferase [Altererythrobacter sp.]MBO6943993.1 L-histidine N(alpha)-methyltransferase [Altererythrobacter sp.]
MASNKGIALVNLDEDGVDRAFRADVLQGLSEAQKAIPARWLYDDAGSQLFEDITRLPEYYPTRSEREILEARGAEFADLIGPDRAVVEFGSGSSVKTPLLLSAIDPAAYVPLDISGDFLRASSAELSAKFPGLPVYPVEADFMRRVELPTEVAGMPKLGFFPGSTIGNMVARTAVDLLRTMRETLGEGSKLLIGMDLIKDRKVLIAAYDDAAGVTAEFNLNLIRRINRELDADIPFDALQHEARWNDEFARIEMHLVATRDLQFTVSGKSFAMREGESIHTENSHKFNRRTGNALLLAGGWTPVQRWTDSEERFSLVLADATIPRSAL